MTAGDGIVGGGLIAFDAGTKALASGNIEDMSFANGLVDGKAGAGVCSTAVDSASDGLEVEIGDGMAFGSSAADIVGVKGDI